MKKIYLVISPILKPIEPGDYCFYRFDKASYKEITDALDLIQDKEAKKYRDEL